MALGVEVSEVSSVSESDGGKDGRRRLTVSEFDV